jgi:hypothetical protein
MTKNIRLLDMAKLTYGQSMARGDDLAVSVDGKVFVKSFEVPPNGGVGREAYCPVIFEKDIIHHIKMLLHGDRTEGERAALMYLAYELGLEDELIDKHGNLYGPTERTSL